MGVDAVIQVRFSQKKDVPTKEKLLEVSRAMGDAFGADRFFIDREREQHALSLHTQEYFGHKDKDHVEELISVNTWARYYGPGYERGDFPFIIMLCEYLAAVFPNGDVYYGGDSGYRLAPWDDVNEELWDHFTSSGRRPYVNAFSDFLGRKPPTCGLCKWKYTNNGGGGRDSFWSCTGCGHRIITDSNGKISELNQNEDFFAGLTRIREGK